MGGMDIKRTGVSSCQFQKGAVSWRKRLVIIGAAVALQGSLLGLALLIGVLDPSPPREARLKLPPSSVTRQNEQRQEMNQQLARFERMQKEGMQQLQEALLESARPDIPVHTPDLQQSIQAMGAMLPIGSLSQGGMGSFSEGMGGEALPMPDPVSFLGESLSAKSIILLLDVSGSVKTKMERAGISMEALREEVHRFIAQLSPNHLFGIIQFTRNWQVFRPELLPATTKVRTEAADWINSSFRTTGTSGRNWSSGNPNGIEGVLKTAFSMDAGIDEIFIVSDGDFYRTPSGGGGQNVPWSQLRDLTRRLQQENMGTTRLRVLCFYPPDRALPDLRAWVHENGQGTLRVMTGRE